MTISIQNKIHQLLILHDTGIGLYHRKFTSHTKDVNINLITGFISALFTFSEEMVSRKLEVLDLKDLRLVFRYEQEYIFLIVSGSTENLIFVNKILDELVKSFFYFKDKNNWVPHMEIENEDFNKLVDMLIVGFDEVMQFKSQKGYYEVIEYLSDLIFREEILGAAILTENGSTIYSSLESNIYERSMRELELRYKLKAFDLPEHIYILPNEQIVCEKIANYKGFVNFIIILHFPARTQLGIANIMVEKIVNMIDRSFN